MCRCICLYKIYIIRSYTTTKYIPHTYGILHKWHVYTERVYYLCVCVTGVRASVNLIIYRIKLYVWHWRSKGSTKLCIFVRVCCAVHHQLLLFVRASSRKHWWVCDVNIYFATNENHSYIYFMYNCTLCKCATNDMFPIDTIFN